MDNSVKTTIQRTYDMGSIYNLHYGNELLKEQLTFNGRQRGESELN